MCIERLAAGYDIDVVYRHFPLHPETPADGLSLEELFAGRNLDIPAMQAAMQQRMDEQGLAYAQRSHTYNSRMAQELGKWADQQPGGQVLHEALFRAYFVDNVNLAEVENLVSLAAAAGLNADDAGESLASRRFRDDVDADWQRSAELGITGVPTYIAGEQGVVGAQPLEVLERLVSAAGAVQR